MTGTSFIEQGTYWKQNELFVGSASNAHKFPAATSETIAPFGETDRKRKITHKFAIICTTCARQAGCV